MFFKTLKLYISMKNLLFLLLAASVLYSCNSPKSYYAFDRQTERSGSNIAENSNPIVTEGLTDEIAGISIEEEVAPESPEFIVSRDKFVETETIREHLKSSESKVNEAITSSKSINREEKSSRVSISDIREGLKIRKELKNIEKEYQSVLESVDEDQADPKSQLVALLLGIFIGALGIHRFYLGYTTIGILQLLTAGGCGIWALIDIIRIITGDLKPADGSDYDPKL